jgi:hypothetical protein
MLKYKIKAFDGLDEAVQSMYKKEDDGSYVLQVEGAVAKDRLDEFRNNNIEMQKQLDKLKDIDPVKYRELMAIENQVREKKLIEAGKVDEAVELRVRTMREELDGKVASLQSALDTANSQLSILTVDNVIKTAAVKHGILPGAIDDVVLRAKTVYQMKDGKAVPMSGGEVIYGKDGETPMPPEEWMLGLKKTAPHLFQGFNGSGAGGGQRPGGLDPKNMSPTEKINEGLRRAGVLKDMPA